MGRRHLDRGSLQAAGGGSPGGPGCGQSGRRRSRGPDERGDRPARPHRESEDDSRARLLDGRAFGRPEDRCPCHAGAACDGGGAQNALPRSIAGRRARRHAASPECRHDRRQPVAAPEMLVLPFRTFSLGGRRPRDRWRSAASISITRSSTTRRRPWSMRPRRRPRCWPSARASN